jgi:hypothetical protein
MGILIMISNGNSLMTVFFATLQKFQWRFSSKLV